MQVDQPKPKTEPPKIVTDLAAALSVKDMPSPFHETCAYAPTGSRRICTPPVMDTDDDWIVYIPMDLSGEAADFLDQAGAQCNDSQMSYNDGVSYRYGEVNLILLWDYQLFHRWVSATYWAAKFNLTDKRDRKDFFQSIVDGALTVDVMTL